ncbi:MAG: bifunctional riboflavin kinase/FAD synthetase [Lentisphaeria bacterium]|nr:bifunctional riboflavin kinase/FAD synthetase [Lentisphaeria bacterium]
MNCYDSLIQLTQAKGKIALACGNFDGVHLGHQQLLSQLIDYSESVGATPAIFTFHPHPRKVIGHDKSVALLTSFEHKLKLFAQYGIKHVICHNFTLETAKTDAECFARNELINAEVCALFVGKAWRFGHRGQGSILTLESLGLDSKFEVKTITEIGTTEEKVSSTNIRKHLIKGEMKQASNLLGRNFSLLGQVISGEGIATGKLGFPTANLEVNNEVIPPSGVYAGYIRVHTAVFKCIINVGYSPTFHETVTPTKVEAHIFDFDGDIYHKEVELEFLDFIRPEQKFESKEALIEEINRNIATVKELLSKVKTTL